MRRVALVLLAILVLTTGCTVATSPGVAPSSTAPVPSGVDLPSVRSRIDSIQITAGNHSDASDHRSPTLSAANTPTEACARWAVPKASLT